MLLVHLFSPPRPLVLLAVLILSGCDGETDGSSTEEERFHLTVSGPAFDGPRTFRLDLDRISWNVGSDGSFVATFVAQGDPIVSDDGSRVLDSFSGGLEPGTLDGAGTISLGTTADGSNGWSIIIWPSGCPDDYAGCDRVNLSTGDGTMDVLEHTLGQGPSRPHAEGPTVLSASFEAAAEELDPPNEGRAFQVEGSFHLVDGE